MRVKSTSWRLDRLQPTTFLENLVHTHRVLPTDSVSAIQPFSTQELQIKNGFYYGLNQLSKNIIVYNRGISNNQNGVILGSPGAGKSFAAKILDSRKHDELASSLITENP